MIPQLKGKIRKDDSGCWVWTAYRDRHGYGKINYGGRPPKGRVHFAHRLAYQLERGPIPDGMVLDHVCRNPSCVNPDHLEIVTQSVNVLRGQKATHCKRGHTLEGSNIRIAPHNGQRVCKACHRIREANRRERNRGTTNHGDTDDGTTDAGGAPARGH